MELKEFTYELPRSLIAATPTSNRAAARLMVVHRESGEICHREFSSLGDFVRAGDALVLNDAGFSRAPSRPEGKRRKG